MKVISFLFVALVTTGCSNNLKNTQVGTPECRYMLTEMEKTGFWLREQDPSWARLMIIRCADSIR